MWDKYIREERIALERVLAQKCYWWVLIYAELCIFIKGKQMNIRLPLPAIRCKQQRSRWDFNYLRNKEHDEAEIARCKAIWSSLTESIQEKMQKIETGESTVEDEFKDGILFEDGKYGLKYKESWVV